MTEEEKKIAATAEAEEKTEEKEEEKEPDLTVVMPEANRVVMPQEEYKEQPAYLTSFANFYIAKFSEEDLEIMGMYDNEHNNIVDINTYLLNNIHFTRKNLVKHVLQYHDYNFKAILDEIVKDEHIEPETMTTFDAWDDWYEDRRSRITGSLS